jgi:hypothetical protein
MRRIKVMRRLLVFPTWVIVRIMLPFLPKGHPWKGRRFTLRDWAQGSTEANDLFSMAMWVGGICVAVSLIIIF